jgi:dTDP-4-dehydrorhamnose reductase
MTTVSVVGAEGFIGARLVRHLAALGPGRFAVTGTVFGRPPGPGEVALDVTDPRAVEAHLATAPDFVVLLAGTKDLKACEARPELAMALNAAPVEAMARIVARDRLATRIAYFSSDYVFDGLRGGYRDDEPPAPRTAYGRSKAAGEEALRRAGGPHKVIRSAAVMGRGGTFFDWLLPELASGREVRLFADSFFSPTPVALLCDLLVELLDRWDAIPGPVQHLVGDRRLSRHGFGELLAGVAGGDRSRLVPDAGAKPGAVFQHDLSMVPSAWVRQGRRPSLEEYLAREVQGC